MSPKKSTQRTCDGFALVEILIVVVILGILAAAVVPKFSEASTQSRQAVFVTDIKSFVTAAWFYMNKEGGYLEDCISGQCPSGWDAYVDENKWTNSTSIGGLWDIEQNDSDITSGLGVHYYGDYDDNPGDDYMAEIDAMLDDGNLSTGGFQKLGDDRYFYILIE